MELWARKRPINNVGQPYEYITTFWDENQKYCLSDLLDRTIYQECMVVDENRCVMYREFDKPLIKKKVSKRR